jgi:hypothetical protein
VVAVEAVIGISIIGHVVAATDTVAIVIHWAILGVECVPAWIVHELLIICAKVAGVARVAIVVAAVVAGAGAFAVATLCLA